jgi:hypothetical protein
VAAFLLQGSRIKVDLEKLNSYPGYLFEYYYILIRPGPNVIKLFTTVI